MVRFIVTLRKHLELNECQWCYPKDPIAGVKSNGVRLLIAFRQRRPPRGRNAKRKTRSELLRGWTANSRTEGLWKGLDRGHGETWKLDPVQQRGNRGVRDRAALRTP